MKQLRVQIPYKKYGVIEFSTEITSNEQLDAAIAFAKQLIDKHSNVEADVNKVVSEFVKPNEKQLGLIKRLGGDINKQFKNWDAFSTYVEELKAKNPQGNSLQAPKPAYNSQPAQPQQTNSLDNIDWLA